MNSFGNPEDIEFPQTMSVRVIMEESAGTEVIRARLEDYFKKAEIQGDFTGRKPTSAGNYASYAYRVTFANYAEMKDFYLGLKEIPGVKTAL